MPLQHFCAVIFAMLLCLPSAAHAGKDASSDSGTDPAVAIEHQRQHYVVDPSGAYRLTVDERRSIATARAVQNHGQYAIRYNQALDDVVTIDAYTQKPDGRRVPVQPGQIRDRPEATAPGAAVFDKVQVKVVVFPELAVGDLTVVRYVIQRSRPPLPGHFDQLVTVPFYRVRSLQVVVDLPAGMTLHADAAGFVAMPDAHPPGRRRHAWRYVDGANPRLEAGSVSPIDYGRRLALSTFADYPAFAAAFRQAQAGKALATPAMATLARQRTAGLPDPQARALALTDWVRGEVRMKTCQDPALRLVAMLSAVGIESTTALINNGNAYKLPQAPTLGVFNHVIVYVPGLDLYLDPTLDPTIDAVGAGDLAPSMLGKPVLLLDTGRFAMTPLLQAHKVVTAATVDIGRHGHGSFSGSGDTFASLPAPGALATTHGARSVVDDAIKAMTVEAVRRQDYVCPAVDAEDNTDFRLPRGARILALPRPMNLMDGGLFYSAIYTRKGDAIAVRRRLTFRHGRPTCSPADYRAMRPLLERIQRDLRSRIVVAGG